MTNFPLAQWADKEPGRWILLLIVVAVLWIGSFFFMQASDGLAEAKAMEEDLAQAQRQAQQELAKQKARQAACGGPEATVVELAQGGYACLDTNGRRTKTIQRSPA